ncbi:MAG: hypothetical protein IT178_04550 [Acidobacteria bacterium]|nr:hypothetical protein [Acidobacteriota bacterium]
MRLVTRLVIAAFVVVAATASGRAQDSIAGDWTITIDGPQGIIDTDATFALDGDKVTGTMSSEMGDSNLTGTYVQPTLTLAFNVATPQGPIDVTMTAEVSGAEMKGTLDFGMGTAPFTGKRK